MLTAQKVLFLYVVSPLHMGAGTALGLIDNPIQRERHTGHPMIAGAGLKGAIRHRFHAQSPAQRALLERYFGPDKNASEYAGAVSFSDAQLVAFPVRCSKAGYVYATSPLALARAQRLLVAAGHEGVKSWKIPQVKTGNSIHSNNELLSNGKLQVDAFELVSKPDVAFAGIATWLAQHAFPQEEHFTFFRDKFNGDLVLMSDDDFGYFVRNATSVEPHVRISNETGTAESTGLFYTENLPPESLLISVVMTSDERSTERARGESARLGAQEILDHVVTGGGGFGGLSGETIQAGGDASTGRGQIVIMAAGA